MSSTSHKIISCALARQARTVLLGNAGERIETCAHQACKWQAPPHTQPRAKEGCGRATLPRGPEAPPSIVRCAPGLAPTRTFSKMYISAATLRNVAEQFTA